MLRLASERQGHMAAKYSVSKAALVASACMIVATSPTAIYAAGGQSCRFDGTWWGFLYAAPNWDAPKLSIDIAFPCLELNDPVIYYDRHKVVHGPQRYTIEVLQDVNRFDRVLRKGDTFQSSDDTGEGACDLYFKKSQPVQKSTEPLSFDCVWLSGYAHHESNIFRIKEPGGGDQQWWHLVKRDGAALGWYLTGISSLSPEMSPIPRPATK